jgi:hypothetical protein
MSKPPTLCHVLELSTLALANRVSKRPKHGCLEPRTGPNVGHRLYEQKSKSTKRYHLSLTDAFLVVIRNSATAAAA